MAEQERSRAVGARSHQSHASSAPISSTDKKKLRNRLSQQAFRQRQSAYIQQLERRLEIASKSDNDRLIELENENKRLREQQLDFHNRLRHAQASLTTLSQVMASLSRVSNPSYTLNEGTSQTSATYTSPSEGTNTAPPSQTPSTVVKDNPPSSMLSDVDLLLWNESFLPSPLDQGLGQSDAPMFDQEMSSYAANSHSSSEYGLIQGNIDVPSSMSMIQASPTWASFSNAVVASTISSQPPMAHPSSGIPGIWSYSYQMGPNTYQAAINTTFTSTNNRNSMIRATNSPWSDHIFGMQNAISARWRQLEPTHSLETRRNQLHASTSIMLSLFHSMSRPSALAWYTQTRFYYHIADLMIWQIDSSRDNYMRLHSRYRPSALQLTETYPPVIDWCPFGSVRDRMILTHSADPRLDEVICDMATAYVVETDISKLVKMDSQTRGFIRVWDLIQAIGVEGEEDLYNTPSYVGSGLLGRGTPSTNLASSPATSSSSNFTLPAPTVQDIFSNRAYARLVFKALNMDSCIALFKLDPKFFIKHPELHDPQSSDIIASGTPLMPQTQSQTKFTSPSALSAETWRIYSHLADWSTSVICKKYP